MREPSKSRGLFVAYKILSRAPGASVEANLRSGDRCIPEELNCPITDAISDWFFLTGLAAMDNFLQEGKPREKTERPVTITESTNAVVGVRPGNILGAVCQMLRGQCKSDQRPELWGGRVAEHIVEALAGPL